MCAKFLTRLESLARNEESKMTTATKTTKATKAVKVATPSEVVISPAVQRQVKNLRTNRDNEKIAKAGATEARKAILDFFGEVTSNTIGTDAKGKRLVSVKVIPSTESINWTELQEQDPELYQSVRAMLKDYITPKGKGNPTIRVDVI